MPLGVMGIFADWQPVYAEHGVATFPVTIDENGKRPSVRGYLKAGKRASSEWTSKFGDSDALGFALRPNRITVLDVDTPDENFFADALDRHGPSPLIMRSYSGNWQAWYRNNGEPRRIRPWGGQPIDVLGDGFTVAPPSRGDEGQYQIAEGSLDDLDRLPTMLAPPARAETATDSLINAEQVRLGQRNSTLYTIAMKLAHECENEAELLQRARGQVTERFEPVLSDNEIKRTVAKAWEYTVNGTNYVGRPRTQLLNVEIDALLSTPDALHLLIVLKRYHWNRTFVIANAMADQGLVNMSRKRLAAARKHLERQGYIHKIRGHSKATGPALYCWPS